MPNWETVLRAGGGLYYDTYANAATNATAYYPHPAGSDSDEFNVADRRLAATANGQLSAASYTNQNILGFDQNWRTPADA